MESAARMGCQGRVTAARVSTFILIFASVLCTNGELQQNASFATAAQLNQGFRDVAHLNSTARKSICVSSFRFTVEIGIRS